MNLLTIVWENFIELWFNKLIYAVICIGLFQYRNLYMYMILFLFNEEIWKLTTILGKIELENIIDWFNDGNEYVFKYVEIQWDYNPRINHWSRRCLFYYLYGTNEKIFTFASFKNLISDHLRWFSMKKGKFFVFESKRITSDIIMIINISCEVLIFLF